MRLRLLVAATSAFSVFLFATSAKADLITNGTFSGGTLTGWTVFATSNGTAGSPDVVSFDTTGGGANNAAQFNVGQIIHDSTQQGGGLSQDIFAPSAGLYTFTESFASQDDANGTVNEDAGTFSIIVDGAVVASDGLGVFTAPGQILRGSFDETVSLTAGLNTFETEITRHFLSGGGANTPDEYLDNISATPSTVVTPEPSTLALIGTGILGVAVLLRKRFV